MNSFFENNCVKDEFIVVEGIVVQVSSKLYNSVEDVGVKSVGSRLVKVMLRCCGLSSNN